MSTTTDEKGQNLCQVRKEKCQTSNDFVLLLFVDVGVVNHRSEGGSVESHYEAAHRRRGVCQVTFEEGASSKHSGSVHVVLCILKFDEFLF